MYTMVLVGTQLCSRCTKFKFSTADVHAAVLECVHTAVLSAWFLERFFGVLGQCVIKKSARAVLETCFYARDTEDGRC